MEESNFCSACSLERSALGPQGFTLDAKITPDEPEREKFFIDMLKIAFKNIDSTDL